MPEPVPFLRMLGITKNYPGVQALKGVNLEIRAGEVHALVGENGAGKSTLMKILAGAETMDAGEIHIGGQQVVIDSPHKAQELQISIIYQEFNLVPQLGAAENIFLGREPTRLGFVDFRRERREARRILDSLGISFDLDVPVSQLSIAQQQMVEIAKALSIDAKIIAMDEPSATLTLHELKNLFALIRALKEKGISVIYISHRLEEIFEVCDRLTVLRDGEWIGTRDIQEISREGIIEMMVGRKITDEFPWAEFPIGEEVLRVEGLTRGFVKEVSFSVRQGEIVALTGLVGAGRTEVARMIFGADPPEKGSIWLEGRPIELKSPRHAIDSGICLLTEDRKSQGLILGMRIRENITLPKLREFCRFLFINGAMERKAAGNAVKDLTIKAPSIETEVRNLSGGNQQKVVLAKWLLANSKLFIFDEPTRGIDVGAKREIYLLMNELLRRGAAILMISSELPEVLGMANRILVMSGGRLAGELHRNEATQEKIMHLATLFPSFQERELVA
ncbi:MAG TPA: sugar ABC transporter ATP-binding protein [bacterium]|nr:sugar ABC transporter ATP-binding protein [bacterium]HPO99312.1 sugar ABC transporter ATP-binding protein [bacterium]